MVSIKHSCGGSFFEDKPCRLIRQREVINCQKLHAHYPCPNQCYGTFCLICFKHNTKSLNHKRGSKDISLPISIQELKEIIESIVDTEGHGDILTQTLICVLYLSGRRVSEIVNKITKKQISIRYSNSGKQYLTIHKVKILKKRDWYIIKEMKVMNYDDFINEGKKKKDWEDQMNISTKNGHIPQHIGNNNYSFCFTVKKPKKTKSINESDVELLPEETGFFLEKIKLYLQTLQYDEDTDFLFPMDRIAAHQKIYRASKGKLFPHYLRHLRVSYMFKMGTPESEIVRFMGWSSAAPLETYKHLTQQDRLEMMMERLVKD